MDMLSIVGATASLECAILLMAAVLLMDYRRSLRRNRLLVSMRSTLFAGFKKAA